MSVGRAAAALLLASIAALAAPSQALMPVPLPPGEYGWDVRPGLSVEGWWAWSDYPYYVPLKQPLVVVAAEDVVSANFTGPVTLEVATPEGSFERILMRVDVWLESSVPGRPAVQYDRPLWVWVEGAPAFVGTTVQRFNGTAFQDVTHLYPLLTGGGVARVTVALPNWNLPAWGLTGIFHVRVTLLYYPGPRPAWAPDAVVPLWVRGDWGVAMARLDSSSPLAWQEFSVPPGTYRAVLLVYTEGASYDEFFYYRTPPVRYVEVSADGQPVAYVQPFPYMYTGSLNPLMWRPVPGVRTLAFEPHFIDVSPFLGVLSGGESGATVNLTVRVVNGLDYWLVFAAMLLYIDGDAVYSYYVQEAYSLEAPTLEVNETATEYPDLNLTIYEYNASSTVRLEGATRMVHVKYWGQASTATAWGFMENGLEARLVYDSRDEWYNLTLMQWWRYEATVAGRFAVLSEWREEWSAVLESRYGFVIDVELPEDPEAYPVEGNFTLYTSVYQELNVTRDPHPVTRTYRSLSESANATAYIEGTIMLISPTAGIITGITDTYGENVRVTRGAESGPRVGFEFERVLHGWNEWPAWAVLEDRVRVRYGP